MATPPAAASAAAAAGAPTPAQSIEFLTLLQHLKVCLPALGMVIVGSG